LNLPFDIPVITIISIICFIPAIVIHEVAHGFVAHRLGDPTAKRAGRITLNPLKHVDPFGTVILPAVLVLGSMATGGVSPIFGYAKPVPYNPRYFKNIRVGEFLTGFAGPASNVLMALLAAIVGNMLRVFPVFGVVATDWILVVCYLFAMINLCLAFFNLIPIPPLDGASIIALFLPDKALKQYYSIQRYAMPVLLVVLFVVPYFLNFSIIGMYLDVTALSVMNLLF
jgi:Zn-dependent protease